MKKIINIFITIIIIIIILFFYIRASKELSDGRNLSEFSDELSVMDYVDFLVEYEGYLDNVKDFGEEYKELDYDQDGKRDRILQYFLSDGGKMYAICFGNGKILEIGPFDDNMLTIKISAADLTGDGKNEIIFCGEHSYSTNPQSGSKIAVWTLVKNKYKRMSIAPEENYDKYEVSYPIFIEKIYKEYEILITSKELGLKEVYQISENSREEFDSYFRNLNINEKDQVFPIVWDILIESKENGEIPSLILYEDFLYRLYGTVEIKLRWNGNKFEVEKSKLIIK